jgi:methylthioribose-1-phosphate isomerase
MDGLFARMARARPTAVNLHWACERMRRAVREERARGASDAAVAQRLEDEARRIHADDLAACRAMGRHGATLVPERATLLTHCNAGALATAGYGTALGVVRAAVEAGKKVRVLADETRPFLQGSRLTAWELMRDGIETVLIADSAAGSLLRAGEVDLVVVGADRIARNGDVANKIGTYSLSVLARENGVPFYVAAPLSTIDFECPDGDRIPIEDRDPREVTELFGSPTAPAGVGVRNPAFDVTPARYVAAIITEEGIARPPYDRSLAELADSARRRGVAS